MARKIIIKPLKNSPVYVWSSEPEKQRVKAIINKKRLAILISSPQVNNQSSFDVCLYAIKRPGVDFLFNTNPIDGYKNRKMKRVRRGKLVHDMGWGITKVDTLIYLAEWGDRLKVDLKELLDVALKTTALIKVFFDNFSEAARPWAVHYD